MLLVQSHYCTECYDDHHRYLNERARMGDAARSFSALGGAIVGLAIISTAVAYILYFKILERSGATNVLLVTLLVPVSAILLGSLFLNETLQTIHLVGMALIALGLSAIDGRLWRLLKTKC